VTVYCFGAYDVIFNKWTFMVNKICSPILCRYYAHQFVFYNSTMDDDSSRLLNMIKFINPQFEASWLVRHFFNLNHVILGLFQNLLSVLKMYSAHDVNCIDFKHWQNISALFLTRCTKAQDTMRRNSDSDRNNTISIYQKLCISDRLSLGL